MADAREKGKTGASRGQPTQEREQRRDATGRDTSGAAEAPREDLDPREEEGWGQPESSAQKGALPDEG
jgi:hypothetical protein